MKKSNLGLAACAAFSLGYGATEVHAQSSVTLYGIVDVNVRSIHNGGGGTVLGMGEGTLNASRIGFKGIEDLGGGWKAGFVLESGFRPYNGAQSDANRFFNRRATVSMINDDYGELRIGRDNSPAYWNLIMFDPYGGGGVGSFINLFTAGGFSTPLLSGAGTLSRTDNSITYWLPKNLGGVYGQLQYSFNNAPGFAGSATGYGNKQWGGRLGYANGPLDIAAVVNSTQLDRNYTWNLYDIGASYMIGRTRVMAQYSYMDTSITDSWEKRSGQHTFLLGATIPIYDYTITTSYSHAQGTGGLSDLRADMYALGGILDLSKRTALYANVAAIKNRGKAAYITGPEAKVTASSVKANGAYTPGNMAGKSSVGMELGIRTIF